MFVRATLVASTLVWLTFANVPTPYCGTSTSLTVQPDQLGTQVVAGLYAGCSERDSASGGVTTGSVCIARLISYMLQSIAIVADGSESVAVVNSTINSANSSSSNARRDTFSSLQHDDDPAHIHVTHTTSSNIHPQDGLAYRMNVQNDNTALYVHTNGSHAVARFENDEEMLISKRSAFLPADENFSFSGPQGMKVEAQGLQSSRLSDSRPDLIAYSYAFGFGNGVSAVFQQGDSWKYTLCDKVDKSALFSGRIIAELTDFNSTYEPMVAPVEAPACSPCPA